MWVIFRWKLYPELQATSGDDVRGEIALGSQNSQMPRRLWALRIQPLPAQVWLSRMTRTAVRRRSSPYNVRFVVLPELPCSTPDLVNTGRDNNLTMGVVDNSPPSVQIATGGGQN